MKWFLLCAIFFGISAFILDAFFAHGLRAFLGERYEDSTMNALSAASRYQLSMSIFMILLIVLFKHVPSAWVIVSECFVILGFCLFCLPIYLKHLGGIPYFIRIAPLGGLSFMASFAALLPLLWTKLKF